MAKLFFFIFLSLSFNCFAEVDTENLEINADQFTYDKENKRVFATGNVEVIDKTFTIFANKVFLNTEKKLISAKDDVRIFYEDGSILRTNSIVADNNLENAKFSKSYLYLPDDAKEELFKKVKRYSRLASNSMERRSKTWEVFQNAVFTACDICYDKKKKKFKEPLIQVKSKKVVHDKNKFVVNYYDSYIEFSGQPVFYLPYLSHASPLVKRKSGFLAPTFKTNHYFGNSFDIPYYVPINNHHDITFIPKFSTKQNPVGFIEHRKNFGNGEMVSEVSGTINKLNVNQLKKDKIRGHFRSSGKFDISNTWKFDYNLDRTTDRNYLNTFNYGYHDTLNNNLRFRGYRKNNFYSLEAHSFQEIRHNVDQKNSPRITPRIKTIIKSPFKLNTLNYKTDFEYLTLTRDEGTDVSKLSFIQDIEFPMFLKDGSIIKLGTHLNAGLYRIENYNDPITSIQKNSYFRTKLYPQITFEYSKPFYKRNRNSKQIFEPKILIVGGANNGNDINIPNEDSRSYDLDFIDLFNKNRLSGNDRLDNGSRIDYGFSYLNQNLKESSITNISIGHSYRLKRDLYQPSNSGSNKNSSNIVTMIDINPTRNVSIRSQASLNSDNFSFAQSINDLSISNKRVTFNINHLFSKATSGLESTSFAKRNQLSLNLKNSFTEYFDFINSTSFDLIDEMKFLNWSSKLKYEDECFGVSFTWDRRYTYNYESPTSNSFVFMFSLKKIMENDL